MCPPLVLAEFSCMFSDEKCSLEDFALWIESVMDSCFKVGVCLLLVILVTLYQTLYQLPLGCEGRDDKNSWKSLPTDMEVLYFEDCQGIYTHECS